jgi:hypothetical protein
MAGTARGTDSSRHAGMHLPVSCVVAYAAVATAAAAAAAALDAVAGWGHVAHIVHLQVQACQGAARPACSVQRVCTHLNNVLAHAAALLVVLQG